MSEQTETPAATEGQDGSQEEMSTEQAMDTAFSDSTEEATESQEQKPSEFDWSQYQNADHFKGRTVQEVIDYHNRFQQNYGQQANELGRLRDIERQFNQLKAQFTGQPQQREKPKLSDAEMIAFANKFGEKPYEAFSETFIPKIVEELKGPLMEQARKELTPYVQEQLGSVAIQQEHSAFLRNHAEEFQKDPSLYQMTGRLMYPDYLGDNVSYEEAYNLAKMTKSEPNLFGDTCALMQRGVPYAQARKYALGAKTTADNAETKKDKIKGEFKGLKTVAKGSSKKQSADEEVIEDMDDAFDIED